MNVTTNELIPISESNGKKAVNARDLHYFLESKQQFADWIKNRIEKYDFIENLDYQVFHNSMNNPVVYSYKGSEISFEKFDILKNVRIFALQQFHNILRFVDFLCPHIIFCIRYRQRFLRTYSPTSRYGTVASWRNSLLYLFI